MFVLISGNSLTGKTRMTINAINNIENANVFVLRKENFDENIKIKRISKNKNILFLDDIEDLFLRDDVNPKNIMTLFDDWKKQNIAIAATTTNGEELGKVYEFLKSNLDLFRYFEEINVETYKSKDRKKLIIEVEKFYKNENISIDKEIFDGNFGKLFMEFTKMKERYEMLKKEKNKNALLILKAIRFFSKTFNFKNDRNTFDAVNLFKFCYKYEQK